MSKFGATSDQSENPSIDKEAALLAAIDEGNIECVKELIADGVDVDTVDGEGVPALHCAISSRETKIVQALIDAGANKEVLFEGGAPLYYAISEDLIEIVQALIDADADIEVMFDGMSPLHQAISQGQVQIALALINKGADIKALYEGMTPLLHARIKKQNQIQQVLIEKGASVISDIHLAIFLEDFEQVVTLIKEGADKEALYIDKTLLHHAISKAHIQIVQTLIDADVNKEALYKNKTPLQYAISKGQNEIAQLLIDAGVNKEIPFNILRKTEDPALIEAMFPYCLIEGTRLSILVPEPNCFSSLESKLDFLQQDNPLDFLERYNFISPITLTALRLMVIAHEVKEYESSLLLGNENAMDNAKVARANWHFTHKIKPYFEESLLNYSPNQDKDEAIAAIEVKIRELLLNAILMQAQESQDQKVIEFINQNKADLIAAQDEITKASVAIFTLNGTTDYAQAAMRGYNPYAPVKDPKQWPNLLTKPLTNEEIWTTEIAHKGELGAFEAFAILKERIAYYYIAVIDPFDGDADTRQSRITNFITKLADIRNAHGIDDPTCYPGALTRIADMGTFHTVAQLPPTTKEMVTSYIQEKALKVFQDKLNTLIDMEAKEALYNALVELTENTAKRIIELPEEYEETWLGLRQEFIAALGSADENIEEIFEKDLFPIVDNDLPYVQQALMDIGNGSIGKALSDYFNLHTLRQPTQEDIQKANPFKENDKAYELCDLLIGNIIIAAPVYTDDLRQLNNLTRYLRNKVPAILKGGSLKNMLADLEIKEENQEEFFKSITLILKQKGWETPCAIVNPFDIKVEQANRDMMSDRFKDTPMYRNQIEKKRESDIKKQELFNDYLPQVREVFQETQIQNECLKELTEGIASYLAQEMEVLTKENLCQKYLDESVIEFIQKHETQFNALTEMINGNPASCNLGRPRI